MWAVTQRHGQNRSLITPVLQAFHSIHALSRAFSLLYGRRTEVIHPKMSFFNSRRRRNIVCLMQISNFSTVNSPPASDYISTVPITSWPLMFADSSFSMLRKRSEGNTFGEPNSVHFDLASRGSHLPAFLPAFVYHCALQKKRYSMLSVGNDTSHWPDLTSALR